MSKGSKPRPTDLKKYTENWENVFSGAGEIDVRVNDNGAIEIKNSSGESTTEKKYRIIKEYVDQNGIEMVIVNVDDALSNKTMPKIKLRALQHEVVNQETPVLEALDKLKSEQIDK